MLVFLLTAAMVTVLQFRDHGCVRPPTRNPSVLDRMPQGLGKRADLPHLPALLVDLGTHLTQHPVHLDHDAFPLQTLAPLLGSTHPAVLSAFRPRPPPPRLLQGFHDLGTFLRRRHHQDSRRQLEHFQKMSGGLLRGGGSQDDEEEEKKEEEEEEKDARLVVFYSLPRSSDKRGRRGWRPRGRRGKGWALGGKRQAVLDRMPLSYGKKREARTSEGQQMVVEEEEGGSGYRGKVKAENRLEAV